MHSCKLRRREMYCWRSSVVTASNGGALVSAAYFTRIGRMKKGRDCVGGKQKISPFGKLMLLPNWDEVVLRSTLG